MPCAGLCSSCFILSWVSWTEYTDTDDISHVFISPYNWEGIGYPAFYTSNSSSSGIAAFAMFCAEKMKSSTGTIAIMVGILLLSLVVNIPGIIFAW